MVADGLNFLDVVLHAKLNHLVKVEVAQRPGLDANSRVSLGRARGCGAGQGQNGDGEKAFKHEMGG